MKTAAASVLVALVLSATGCAQIPPPGHPGRMAGPGPRGGMPMATEQQMQKMQDEMRRIRATTDPAERRRLMDEHMKSMQQMMPMMSQMGGMGAMGGMGGGPGPGPGNPEQRMQMMEMRMDMMHKMMDQMLQHESEAEKK